jgi:hypothetical protein
MKTAPTDFSFDGSANVVLMVQVEHAPPYLKAFYDRASGGTTGNKVNGRYFVRT